MLRLRMQIKGCEVGCLSRNFYTFWRGHMTLRGGKRVSWPWALSRRREARASIFWTPLFWRYQEHKYPVNWKSCIILWPPGARSTWMSSWKRKRAVDSGDHEVDSRHRQVSENMFSFWLDIPTLGAWWWFDIWRTVSRNICLKRKRESLEEYRDMSWFQWSQTLFTEKWRLFQQMLQEIDYAKIICLHFALLQIRLGGTSVWDLTNTLKCILYLMKIGPVKGCIGQRTDSDLKDVFKWWKACFNVFLNKNINFVLIVYIEK